MMIPTKMILGAITFSERVQIDTSPVQLSLALERLKRISNYLDTPGLPVPSYVLRDLKSLITL